MSISTESTNISVAAATQDDLCNHEHIQILDRNAAPTQPGIEERLEEICHLIKSGVQPPRRTVRELLSWIGVTRRNYNVNGILNNYLVAYELKTTPDFTSANVDDEIAFVSATAGNGNPKRETSYRVGQLNAISSQLVSVTLDSTLSEAVTLMMHSNYSQLPVMVGERDVKGVVSWRSIGKRLALKVECGTVRQCMEPAQIVSAEDSFFSALEIIAKYDYVLVKAKDKKIIGILTASDFNQQFREMAEPFLLVGEIERGIRSILTGHFTGDELQEARAPGAEHRRITGIHDLTFGEYIRLLGTESAWRRIGLHIDKKMFICWLEQIRNLRNNVMHFSPDGFEEKDLKRLQEFAEFLKCLRETGAI